MSVGMDPLTELYAAGAAQPRSDAELSVARMKLAIAIRSAGVQVSEEALDKLVPGSHELVLAPLGQDGPLDGTTQG